MRELTQIGLVVKYELVYNFVDFSLDGIISIYRYCDVFVSLLWVNFIGLVYGICIDDKLNLLCETTSGKRIRGKRFIFVGYHVYF